MSIFTKGLQLYTQAKKSRGLMQNWLIRPKTASVAPHADQQPTAVQAHTSVNAIAPDTPAGSRVSDRVSNPNASNIVAGHATSAGHALHTSTTEVCSGSRVTTDSCLKDKNESFMVASTSQVHSSVEMKGSDAKNSTAVHNLEEKSLSRMSTDRKPSTSQASANHVLRAHQQTEASHAAPNHHAGLSPEFSKPGKTNHVLRAHQQTEASHAAPNHHSGLSPEFNRSGKTNCTWKATAAGNHEMHIDSLRSATKPHSHGTEHASFDVHDVSSYNGSSHQATCIDPEDTAAQRLSRDDWAHGNSACAHTHEHDVIDLTSIDPSPSRDDDMKHSLKDERTYVSQDSDVQRSSLPSAATSNARLGKRLMDSSFTGALKQPRSTLQGVNVPGNVVHSKVMEEKGQ
jgi:hypothetical protein